MKLQTFLRAAAIAISVSSISPAQAGPAYAVSTLLDPATGNMEYRFVSDGFHFGTLLADPAGRLVFRPHPDRYDVNGFGSSWYINPFLAGADPRGGVVDSILAGSGGIDVRLSGIVARSETTDFGTWTFSSKFAYDAGGQIASADGVLDVTLDAPLGTISRDLNFNRIASNYLHNVPQQGGGFGDTGDMSGAVVNYRLGSDPRNFTWRPVLQPAHFPTDSSTYLEIAALGTVNRVDTLALGEGFQIAVSRKPSLELTLIANSDLLSAGVFWNAGQARDFEVDNVGMNHLLLVGNSTDTSLQFAVSMVSTTPVSEPGSLALLLGSLGMLLLGTSMSRTPA